MKVRVLKAFRDKDNGDRVRYEGTIYETNLKRAAMLSKAGVVKLIEPVKEAPTAEPVMEKKAGRPPGMTKAPKKTARITKKIAKSKK